MLRQYVCVVTEYALELVLTRRGLRNIAACIHQRQIVDADIADRAFVQVRFFHRPLERRVAAIAATKNADALRIGDTLRNRRMRSVGDVVLHLAAPLTPAGAFEVRA